MTHLFCCSQEVPELLVSVRELLVPRVVARDSLVPPVSELLVPSLPPLLEEDELPLLASLQFFPWLVPEVRLMLFPSVSVVWVLVPVWLQLWLPS